MRHGHVPAGRSGGGVGKPRQRVKSRFVDLHGASPDLQIQVGKGQGLPVRVADEPHVAAGGVEVMATVDAIRLQAVVIARQDDGRTVQAAQLVLRKVHGLVIDAVVIEQVAGNEYQVDVEIQRAVDDGLEPAVGRRRLGRAHGTVVQVNIRRMQQSQRPGTWWFHVIHPLRWRASDARGGATWPWAAGGGVRAPRHPSGRRRPLRSLEPFAAGLSSPLSVREMYRTQEPRGRVARTSRLRIRRRRQVDNSARSTRSACASSG